jgi:hypothetical protein
VALLQQLQLALELLEYQGLRLVQIPHCQVGSLLLAMAAAMAAVIQIKGMPRHRDLLVVTVAQAVVLPQHNIH